MATTREKYLADPAASLIRQQAQINHKLAPTSAGRDLSAPILKSCAGCLKELPLSAFPLGSNPNFRAGLCTSCQNLMEERKRTMQPIRGSAPRPR
jgi:hypothetical protein